MKETFYISIDYYIYLKEIDFITDLLLKDVDTITGYIIIKFDYFCSLLRRPRSVG